MHSQTVGTRAQVWHGTALKTSGGLTKKHLMMNKHGRIVSRKKHNTAKREKRLVKAGFITKKGQFGCIKKSSHRRSSKSKSRSKRGGCGNSSNGLSYSSV
jgi:hypothetical protein